MTLVARAAALTAIGVLLTSCVDFYNIGDPKFGPMRDTEVAHLVKTIRCELVTYYQTTYQRKRLFGRDHVPYFDLDDNLWGAFYLDLKVVNTIGAPGTNSVFANKAGPATLQTTWQFGPSFGVTDTYELNWAFAIRQNADFGERVTFEPASYSGDQALSNLDTFQCYKAVPDDLEGLSTGRYPELELFDRIKVNGGLPLAAWLLQNSVVMASGYFFPNDKANVETSFPGQMTYSLTVAPGVGIDARYSLVTSVWNPATTDLSLSSAQTSLLVIYINGVKSPTFNAAKVGAVAIVPPPVKPTKVIILRQEPGPGLEKKEFLPNRVNPKRFRAPSSKDRGTFIAPLGLTPNVQ